MTNLKPMQADFWLTHHIIEMHLAYVPEDLSVDLSIVSRSILLFEKRIVLVGVKC